MLTRKNGVPLQCVVVDVNTQRDFCDPDGAFPVHNAGELLPQLRRVIAWAKRNHAPVVSSVESHRPLELSDSGFPICCCVDGSGGQKKLDFTLFAQRAWIEADNTFALPTDLFLKFQQVIFHKRTEDLLSNPKADRLLSQMNAGGYVTAYRYDAAGNITSVTNPDNYTLSFDYDEANRAVHAYDQKNNAVYCSLTATITALLSSVNVCNKYWCGHLGHLAR